MKPIGITRPYRAIELVFDYAVSLTRLNRPCLTADTERASQQVQEGIIEREGCAPMTSEPLLVMTINETDVGSEIIAKGEIDIGSVDMFRSAVNDAANGAGTRVAIDLAGVTFIDSSGLRVLMERWTGATGKRWSLSGLSPQVRRIIEVTGVADVFELDDSTDGESALADARAEYESALERNRAAIDAGHHPPVGLGAMAVLKRRLASAQLRVDRQRERSTEVE